jgi:nucleoside-diphosphate-sugar epimerase
LVYLSSFVVYQPFDGGSVDEARPYEASNREGLQWQYQDSKIAVEDEFLSAYQGGHVAVTILQPTIIYGPFGAFWTAAPIEYLKNGRVILPDDTGGRCNAVYVDDVVEALLLGSTVEKAIGEKFLIGAASEVSWHEYFGAYERALGTQGIKIVPTDRIRHASDWSRARRIAVAFAREPIRATALLATKAASRALPMAFREPIRSRMSGWSAPWKQLIPDEAQLAMYLAAPSVDIRKAREVLGYQPRVSFEEGMQRMAKYIKWLE